MRGQRLCALSTDNRGQPYLSLVAFAASKDLRLVLFATARGTRKFAYLSAQPRVALLIDSRTNRGSDFNTASAVTILGDAEELTGRERERMAKLYLAKHPELADFLSSPDCALVGVRVQKCYLVSEFQNVTELDAAQFGAIRGEAFDT